MKNRARFASIPALALILGVAACGGSPPADSAAPVAKTPPVAVAELSPEEAGGVPKDPNERTAAPHGGSMVELGSKAAFAEFVHDQPAGKLTMYLFEADGITPLALDAKGVPVRVTADGGKAQTIDLAAQGAAAGGASEFAVTSKNVLGVSRFEGVVPAFSLKGQSFGDVSFSVPM